MHSFGIALVPPDTADPESTIKEWMAPYYSEMEVEEYKSFFSAEKATELARYHHVESLDLVAARLRKVGDRAGVEDGRLYVLSTYNSRARWDYWHFTEFSEKKPYHEPTAQIGRALGWDEQLYNDACLVSLLPGDFSACVIVTADEWHDLGDFGWRMMSPEEAKRNAQAKWSVHMRNVLGRYPNHIALAIDVHS